MSAFLSHAAAVDLRVGQFLHDRDTKFSAAVDADLRASGVKVHRTPPRSPNLLAYVERFNLSLKSECLDHFIVFGEKHLNHLVSEWLAHYHEERPHQGKENELLCATVAEFVRIRAADNGDFHDDTGVPAMKLSEIRCHQRLGGLLKHYYRRAA